MGLILEPRRQVFSRHPSPPANLEKLTQIDCVDGNGNINEGNQREFADQWPEQIVLIGLERVVEFVVPAVELHQEIDHREIHGDDDGQ